MLKTESVTLEYNQRDGNRVKVSGFETSIRSVGFLSSKHPIPCRVQDINRGGIGLFSDVLLLKVHQKIAIQITYKEHHYSVQGIVVYRCPKQAMMFYGIMFIHVPYQFDKLINQLIEEPEDKKSFDGNKKSKSMSAFLPSSNELLVNDQIVQGTQRRIDARFDLPELVVRIRKNVRLKFGRYVTCEALDVSSGGISFVSYSFHQYLMGKVNMDLVYKHHTYKTEGTVSYYHPTNQGYHYGVEFTVVPDEFIAIIDQLKQDATQKE